MNSNAKIISISGNVAVVRLPERKFPALAMQGDTLYSIFRDLEIAKANLKSGDTISAFEDIDDLVGRFADFLGFYENSLSKERIAFPYVK